MRKLNTMVVVVVLAAATLGSGCRCTQRFCDWVRRPFCAARCESVPIIVQPTAACAPVSSTAPLPSPMPDTEKKKYETGNQPN